MSDPISKSFTTPQLAQIAGVPERRIFSYIERSYLKPSIQDAAGPGTKRLWSYEDVLRCAIVTFLSSVLSVDTLRHVGLFMEDGRLLDQYMTWTIPVGLYPGKFLIRSRSNETGSDDEVMEFPESSEMVPGYYARRMILPDIREGHEPIQIHVSMERVHLWVKERLKELGL